MWILTWKKYKYSKFATFLSIVGALTIYAAVTLAVSQMFVPGLITAAVGIAIKFGADKLGKAKAQKTISGAQNTKPKKTPASEFSATSGKNKCPHCGGNVPDGSKFCPGCGSTISTSKESRSDVSPPQKSPKKKANPVLVAVVVVLALALGGLFGKFVIAPSLSGGKDNTTTTTTTNMFGELPTIGTRVEPSTSNTQPSSDPISFGTTNGNIYTNNFADITFVKPYDWKYYSADELASAIGTDANTLTGSGFSDLLNKKSAITVMKAIDPVDNDNISIALYDLESVPYGTSISEIEFATKTFEEAEASTGLDYTITATRSGSLGNKWYTIADGSTSYNGVNIFQRIYVHKTSKYLIFITMTAQSESSLTTMENMFS